MIPFSNGYRAYSKQLQDDARRNLNSFMDSKIVHTGPESRFAVPHAVSIQAMVGTAYRTYYHGYYDEAIRDNPQNADAMRNDPFIRRLMDERKYAVCSLKASIEVDNERDPWQKCLKEGLTKLWRMIPRSYQMNWYMLEAEWYGRYASQLDWEWRDVEMPALPKVNGVVPGLPAILGAPSGWEKRRVLTIRGHMPYEGDKIGYDYEGCPYLLISTQTEAQLNKYNADIGPIPPVRARSMEYGYTTAGGKALFLRTPSWRQRFAIHQGEVLDSPFLDVDRGDQIHGIGVRSVIYWYWWLRDEFMSNVADWCARTGLGVRLWYYDASNPASEAAIDQAARDQSDKVNIKIPRYPNSEAQEGVEFVDTTGNGADLMLRLVQYLDEQIELYVVGQSMSRGSQENNGSGFGDRGRVEFARSTKWAITKRSATNYGDTMTQDILDVMKRWSFPEEFQEIPARVVYSVDAPDVDTYLNGVRTFCELGGKVREAEVRNVLGLGDPVEGEATLGGQTPLPAGMSGSVPNSSGNQPEPELPSGEQKGIGAVMGNHSNGRVTNGNE